MHRSTYAIGLLLIGFYLFKLLRFQTLGYTFNDMYAFLQMSRGWMDGRPFMYENIWGYHHLIHNYYTVLLWGPLCRVFGAYGLFAVQVSLLFISYAAVNEYLCEQRVSAWVRYLFLLAILLGPIAFWLNDHPNIGWHTELTYLPLALLFALTLMRGKVFAIILAGLAIVLVKEDGAVLAAMIHLAYEGIRLIQQRPDQPLWRWMLQKRFWLITMGWGAVFLMGMGWLSYKNNFAEPRLQIALTLLQKNIDGVAFWRQMLLLIGQSVLLLLPIIAMLGFLLIQTKNHSTGRILLMWGVGVTILTVLNFVQSVHYYGQPLFYLVSLTWPPRFVLLWGFSAAFLTLLISLWADRFQTFPSMKMGVFGVVLVFIQIPILYAVRPDFPSLSQWKDTLRGRYARDKDPAYLQPHDLAVVRCLADKLPHDANVFAFDFLVPFFHRQYEIWPTGKQYRPADVGLIPVHDKQGLRKALPMHTPYRIIHLQGYDLYVSTAYEQTVRSCLR